MGLYQGRALRSEAPKRRRRGRVRRVLRLLALLAVIAALAHVPWNSLRRTFAVVSHVEVRGLHYLDPATIRGFAGVYEGQDLLTLDLDRARQALLMHPRVAEAKLGRRILRGVRFEVTERLPVLLVDHGVPWELDSAGVLLEPLQEGVVADVPLLAGVDYDDLPAGTQIYTDEVRRGLAWIAALEHQELQLGGLVSEIDVSADRITSLVLSGGTRVLAHAWPPEVQDLSSLRVVLADLERRGVLAFEVDMRFPGQVIVRPVERVAMSGITRKT